MCFSSWNKSNGNVISLRNCFSLYRVRIENICCPARLRFGSAAAASVVCLSMCGRGVENCAIYKGTHVSRHCFYMYLFVHPVRNQSSKNSNSVMVPNQPTSPSVDVVTSIGGLLSDINQYYWNAVGLSFVWKFVFKLQQQRQRCPI